MDITFATDFLSDSLTPYCAVYVTTILITNYTTIKGRDGVFPPLVSDASWIRFLLLYDDSCFSLASTSLLLGLQ